MLSNSGSRVGGNETIPLDGMETLRLFGLWLLGFRFLSGNETIPLDGMETRKLHQHR